MSCYYYPEPTRVWSRVQNQCTFINDSSYDSVYVPLTNQNISKAQADLQQQMNYKGNILQHKKNSARLTKSQKYAQLAKMNGPNRTKVFATQSTTYTNPNTKGLFREGFTTYNFPNEIPGAPNNISGPYAYGTQNPYNCPGTSIRDGGILVCGTLANPCTNELYKENQSTSIICNESSSSDVPGRSILCWNKKINTLFPRQRYVMTNSGNKWPQGYKNLVSAVQYT
jgi:hypothetical protein